MQNAFFAYIGMNGGLRGADRPLTGIPSERLVFQSLAGRSRPSTDSDGQFH